MWAALAALPPRQRAALVLRFHADLSNGEIATHLGISSANARLAVHRGLNRLRKEMHARQEVPAWTTD